MSWTDHSAPGRTGPTLARASVGTPVTIGGISVFPVHLEQGSTGLLAADEAAVRVVTGDGSQRGRVRLENPSDTPALLPLGSVIGEGRATRITLETLVIDEHTEREVRVAHAGAELRSSVRGRELPTPLAPRRVRRTIVDGEGRPGRDASTPVRDERRIRASVARELELGRLGRGPSDRFGLLDRPRAGQLGVVIAHGARIVSAEIFGDPGLLAAHWGSVVAAALAEDVPEQRRRPSASDALELVAALGDGVGTLRPTTDGGMDGFTRDGRLSGYIHVHDRGLVHACAFAAPHR